ncbi:MAG: glycosyltransferase family 2 protein [Candidatus Hydrogenedentota bacterium]|nr:MAG: glycosyltransferase family 2 protein [Candidatus Hydrogenedentota bacterium]
MDKTTPSLGIILVNYNTRDLLVSCLESSKATQDDGVSHVVVDNASSDGSVEALRKAFPEVKVLSNEENHGFAVACNQGAQSVRGDILVMLNTDTLVQDGCWEALRRFFREVPEADIVGGRILNPDDSIQHSLRNFPNLLNALAEAFFIHHPLKATRWFTEVITANSRYARSHETDWVSGAFLACRRKVWEELGGFDESFFMYCEDMDLCRRAYERGYKVYYAVEPTVVHFGGQSSLGTVHTLEMQMRARLKYFTKHHRCVTRFCFVGIQRLYLLVRSIVYSLLGLLPEMREYASRARANWEVFLRLFRKETERRK